MLLEARQARYDRLRPRHEVNFERDPRLVKGSQGRVALYRAGNADAERLNRILQRANARRVVEREPVLGLGHARSAISDLVNDYKNNPTALVAWIPDPCSLCRNHHRNRLQGCAR